MVSFRLDEAYLIGSWCSAALWVQIVQLYKQRRMNRAKWLTATAIVILYCLSTTHAALALRRLVIALIQIQGPDTIHYLANMQQPLTVGKDFMYIMSMIIADTVVVWRCYVVWQADPRVVALLGFLLFGTIQAVDVGYALYAVSLATNVITSFCTVGRVWWQTRALSRSLGSVIAAAKVVEFVLYIIVPSHGQVNGCNGLYVIFDMMPQINGIMPTLIIITVNAGMTIADTQQLGTLSTFKMNEFPDRSSTMVLSTDGHSHETFDRQNSSSRCKTDMVSSGNVALRTVETKRTGSSHDEH
ncbi:hypothetical protein BC629DRAFT_1603933 [Irpex lacteus]|nr:hypothetical protein BC629DRAFT_1603933 [Irpex lacteus]